MGMPTVDELLAFLAEDSVRWTLVGLLSVLSMLFSAMILGFMSSDLLGLEIILEVRILLLVHVFLHPSLHPSRQWCANHHFH